MYLNFMELRAEHERHSPYSQLARMLLSHSQVQIFLQRFHVSQGTLPEYLDGNIAVPGVAECQ